MTLFDVMCCPSHRYYDGPTTTGQGHEISCSAPSGSYCVDFDQGCPATCKNGEYECKRAGLKAGQALHPGPGGQGLRRPNRNEPKIEVYCVLLDVLICYNSSIMHRFSNCQSIN